VDRVLLCRNPVRFRDLSFGSVDDAVSSFKVGLVEESVVPLLSEGRREEGCSAAEGRLEPGPDPV
jgi:hypothetical protein